MGAIWAVVAAVVALIVALAYVYASLLAIDSEVGTLAQDVSGLRALVRVCCAP